MDQSLIEKIKEMMPDFTKLQRRIALFVLEDPMFIAFASVETASKKADVSTATVVRFAIALGYKGYNEFQNELRAFCQSQMYLNPVSRLDRNTARPIGPNSILNDIYSQQIKNLQYTYNSSLEVNIDLAVSLIEKARNIYTCGSRGSYSVAYYLGHHLNRVFANCDVLHVNDRLPDQVVRMTIDDVFIVVNQPRYNKTLYHTTEILKSRGVKIIAISDTNSSPYSKLADVFFAVTNSSKDFHNSMLASMLVTEMMISMVIYNRFPEARGRLDHLEDVFDKMDQFL